VAGDESSRFGFSSPSYHHQGGTETVNRNLKDPDF
jgi:hypothetical protein